MRKGKKLFTYLIWWCNKVWQLPTLEIIQNHFGHCIDISFATLRRKELNMDQLSSGRKRNEINVSFMRQGTTSATESKFYNNRLFSGIQGLELLLLPQDSMVVHHE